jgi:predicted ribosomally synthesized peptide with SipW-like signal peptide
MKKIVLSLAAIVFVGALAAGATGAFFSDSETSTGNTFTAGAIDLKIDSQAHYNGNTCTEVTAGIFQWTGQSAYPVPGTPCDGTWSLTDLGITNKFFNFGDVKPGDNGEDTVSLHIDNNPAWACVDIRTTSNDENTHTQPEINAGDASAGPVGNGELAQNIHFFTWLDNATTSGAVLGDNIWQAGEPILYGPAALSDVGATTTLALADSVTNGATPLSPSATNYIGLAWCAGTLNVSVPGTISCDGSTMGNQSQTDSATADITFRVEQSRNNANFRCVPNQEVVAGPQNVN